MPMRRLASMSRTYVDTSNRRENDVLRKRLAEQDKTIRELYESLTMVAYNALPVPQITMNFYKYGGGNTLLESSSPSLSVVVSNDGLNASTFMSAIGTAINDVYVNPNGPQTFSFYTSTAWSGKTGNDIADLMMADADWEFGAGFNAPTGAPNFSSGSGSGSGSDSPVLYVTNGSSVTYGISKIGDQYGSQLVPNEYGGVFNAYDAFRCAYLLSVGTPQVSADSVDAYILSNNSIGDEFITSLESSMSTT